MRVRVRLFASLREAVGQGEVELELPDGSTAEAAWQRLAEAHAALASRRPRLTAAVNRVRHVVGNKTKFKWKRNGLRHSFCSYRLAITQDAAKTSLEAGNSPQMIFRHYRELTTEDEAKEWFAIMPPKPAATSPAVSATTTSSAKIAAIRHDATDVWTNQRN